MLKHILRGRAAILLIASVLLTGCAGMRIVDSDVTAFSAWTAAPPAPGTRYKFERLPSQTAAPQQDQIEALATTSLSKVGMALSPVDARYSVQVLLSAEQVWRYSSGGYGGFGGFGGGRGGGIGVSFPLNLGEPFYKRSVGLFVRDLTTQKVVFETRAVHNGVWSDGLAVLPAMLDSALLGFPQPPAGTRRINVEIPR